MGHANRVLRHDLKRNKMLPDLQVQEPGIAMSLKKKRMKQRFHL